MTLLRLILSPLFILLFAAAVFVGVIGLALYCGVLLLAERVNRMVQR